MKFLGTYLVFVACLVAKGHSEQQCYVCDNCAKIDENTPVETCGRDAGSTTTMTPTGTHTMSTSTQMSTSKGTTSTTANPMTTTPGSMTYHCYKIEKKYNNVYGVQRGCMGVESQQSVCAELNIANSNQTQKCKPCSTNKCNGSSTIGVSIATVLIALVAVIYRV